MASIKGQYSVKYLQKLIGNSPDLDLVNIKTHSKFVRILWTSSQDIVRKRNSEQNSDISVNTISDLVVEC